MMNAACVSPKAAAVPSFSLPAPGGEGLCLESYEAVRGKIVFRLYPHGEAGRVERDFLDLKILYFVYMGETSVGRVSVPVKNAHLKAWGITEAALYAQALHNMPRLFPSSLSAMEEVLGTEKSPLSMFVLTNTAGFFGAAGILYPGIAQEAARLLKGSYWVLPSSVHELILLSEAAGCHADFLKSMVSAINRDHVSEREVLGNSIYFYDRAKNRLQVAL